MGYGVWVMGYRLYFMNMIVVMNRNMLTVINDVLYFFLIFMVVAIAMAIVMKYGYCYKYGLFAIASKIDNYIS